jgi:hypothetical protein
MIRRYLTRLAWDARITWRALTGRWEIFADAPLEVVTRWAMLDPDTLWHHEQHEAVLAARDELESRAHRWRPCE